MDIGKCIDFDFFIRFITGMQQFLGPGCEIVIHDFRQGFDHSIVHILNGELSGRGIGDAPRGAMIFHEGKDITPYRDSQIFFYHDKKRKIFKSCTTLISDEDNRIVGSVCLNLEVTDLLLTQNALQGLLQYKLPGAEAAGEPDMGIKNIDEVLRHYIEQAVAMLGKPFSLMGKEEKIRAIDYLDQRGVFKISKASVLLCEEFQVSKFTLYNYLEEARTLRGGADEPARAETV